MHYFCIKFSKIFWAVPPPQTLLHTLPPSPYSKFLDPPLFAATLCIIFMN